MPRPPGAVLVEPGHEHRRCQPAAATFASNDKVLGLDVASAGGIKVLPTFEGDHQCGTTWSGITF